MAIRNDYAADVTLTCNPANQDSRFGSVKVGRVWEDFGYRDASASSNNTFRFEEKDYQHLATLSFC